MDYLVSSDQALPSFGCLTLAMAVMCTQL